MGFHWMSMMICCGKSSEPKQMFWLSREDMKHKYKVFSFQELMDASKNNTDDPHDIGKGRFGYIFLGKLDDGTQISIERVENQNNTIERDFYGHVEILLRAQHKNLLGLRGYCNEGKEFQIVRDYTSNPSLLSHLQSDECQLDWEKRMNIAVGAAQGIAYLHKHAKVVHGNINAGNILVTSDFEAQIADFSFAELKPEGKTCWTTTVRGTRTDGYMAPEFLVLALASDSMDVYSFGILLLNLVTGKDSIVMVNNSNSTAILDWALALALAREKKFSELVDPKLNGNCVKNVLKRVIFVGLICAHGDDKKRPTIHQTVELLKGKTKGKFGAIINNDELFFEYVTPPLGTPDYL